LARQKTFPSTTWERDIETLSWRVEMGARRKILYIILTFCVVLMPQSVLTQQKVSDEAIYLDGITLNLGMQKTDVLGLLGKNFIVQHYGGKDDGWRVFQRGDKYRPGTAGSMIAHIEFKDGTLCHVWKKRGDDITALLAVLYEMNKQGKFTANVKINYIGHASNDPGRTANLIVIDYGKKQISVIVDSYKGQTNINSVAEVMEE
jgi:hypothetical protein